MGRWADVCDDLFSQYKELTDRAIKAINEELDIADRDGYTEYGAIEQARIRELFHQAVKTWYEAYSPSEYQRRYDLYNVLDLKTDEYGMAITEAAGYTDLFDEDRMGSDRHGNSLFDKVFMEGWHGGAESISDGKADIWGAHPSPGTPYYRKGGFIPLTKGRRVWHKYGKWGHKAVQTASPAKLFADRFREEDEGNLNDTFIRIMDKHYDRAEERITTRIETISDQIFG